MVATLFSDETVARIDQVHLDVIPAFEAIRLDDFDRSAGAGPIVIPIIGRHRARPHLLTQGIRSRNGVPAFGGGDGPGIGHAIDFPLDGIGDGVPIVVGGIQIDPTNQVVFTRHRLGGVNGTVGAPGAVLLTTTLDELTAAPSS